MTEEEVFSIIDKFQIIYNCNLDQEGLSRLRNELVILSDFQYQDNQNKYFEKHFNAERLSSIYNSNVENYIKFLQQAFTSKTVVTDAEILSYLSLTQEEPNYYISKRKANELIEGSLVGNKFKQDVLHGCWKKQIYQNPKQDLINKITTAFVSSANTLKKESIREIYMEFEDIVLTEREITDEFNKFIKEKNLSPENEKSSPPFPKSWLIASNWIKKEVATGGGNIQEPPQYHPLLAPVAQYVVDLQQVNIPKIKEKFIALNDKGIQKILENLIALRIISSGKDLRLLVQNQFELNLIFDKNNITYTPYFKEPLQPPKDDAQIKNKLQTYYTANNYDFISKSQLADLYHTFQNDFSVTKIENIVSSFLDKNDLIPEQKPKGVSFREQHCSTTWAHKKVVIFPPPFVKKIFLIAVIALVGYVIYRFAIPKGEKVYNISTSANIRSTPNTTSDDNKIGELKYGNVFYWTDKEMGSNNVLWYKYDGIFRDKYISSKLAVSEQDFYLLNSIFADEITKNTLEKFKPRLALIDYFKRSQIFGSIDNPTYEKVFGQAKPFTEVWQVKCNAWEEGTPNAIIFPKASNPNSDFTDFGFIVTNTSNNIKRFVLYKFDDITEQPYYVGEEDATGYTVVNSVSIRSNGTLSVNMH